MNIQILNCLTMILPFIIITAYAAAAVVWIARWFIRNDKGKSEGEDR